LARMLGKHWDTELVMEEFEENPYLKKFYENPEEFAFQLEMSFLSARYSQQRKVFQSLDLFRSQIISDYMLQKCFVFSSNNLSEEELEIYKQFYQVIAGQLPKPELIVYLHRSPPILLDQIAKRGRSFEQKIQIDYLTSIEKAYFNVFKQMKNQRILVLDLQTKDFEQNEEVLKRIINLINLSHKSGIHRFKV